MLEIATSVSGIWHLVSVNIGIKLDFHSEWRSHYIIIPVLTDMNLQKISPVNSVISRRPREVVERFLSLLSFGVAATAQPRGFAKNALSCMVCARGVSYSRTSRSTGHL